MKNTSFKRLWTKTSLKRIRKEYRNGRCSFLCYSSDEFQDLWREYEKEITSLAKKFLSGKYPTKAFSDGSLFQDVNMDVREPSKPSTKCGRKKIRLEFLDHEIKRLSM